MAKKQTRRTVSISKELYDAAMAYALCHALPVSQLVTIGLRAVLAGNVTSSRPPPQVPMLDRAIAYREANNLDPADLIAQRAALVSQQEPTQAEKSRPPLALARRDDHWLAAASADVLRGMAPIVVLPISATLGEDIANAAGRRSLEPDALAEAAIVSMLDRLEARGFVWCRICLQAIGECRCEKPQRVKGVR